MSLEAIIASRSTQSATLAVGIVSSLLLLFLDAAEADDSAEHQRQDDPNHTSVAMLPYSAEQTDLPPYIIHSKTTHEAIFVLAKRDHASGDVRVQKFPGLAAALDLSVSATVSVVELMAGETVVVSRTIESLAADGFTTTVQSGDAKVFLVAAVQSEERHRQTETETETERETSLKG